MTSKKRKPLKRAAKPTAEIKRMRAEVDKIRFGDEKRVTAKTERAAARSKRAIPKPPEVMPAGDPRAPEHFTIAVYKGAAIEDAQMPVDLAKWPDFIARYGVRRVPKAEIAQLARVLRAGFPATVKKGGYWFTAYAVLETGRARDDLAKAAGTLLAKFKSLN